MAQSTIASQIRTLHWQRFSWFSFMITGLFLIQVFQQPLTAVLPANTEITSQRLLEQTNKYRDDYSLSTLNINPKLQQAAKQKANDMIAKDYWSHQTPSGVEPWEFIKNTGYAYHNAGENLAYGFSDGKAVINAWMNSEGHRANLLGQYSEVGFGVVEGKFQGKNNTLIVAMYATPESLPAAIGPGENIAGIKGASVSQITNWLNGSASWPLVLSFLVMLTAGIGFSLTHRRLLAHSWEAGRHFAAVHPVLDLTIIIAIGIFVATLSSGFIA